MTDTATTEVNPLSLDSTSDQVRTNQEDMNRQATVNRYLSEQRRIQEAEDSPTFVEALGGEGGEVGPGGGTTGTAATAAAKDVGLGIVETPRAVLSGARNAVQEALDLTHQLGAELDKIAPLGQINLDLDPTTPFLESGTPEDQPVNLPEIADPESVTGNLIQGVSQFVTGFLATRKALAPIQAAGPLAQMGKAALTGAIADFAVFDEHESRLSDLIQEQPALANPVTEYLASDPTDSFAEGRFKNAVEGLGLGALADGFVAGVRAIRGARAARTAATAAGVPDQPPRITQEEVLSPLGNTSGPRVGNPDAVASPLQRAAAETEPGVPRDVAARGLNEPFYPLQEGTGTDEVFVNFARIDAPKDVQNAMGQMADAMAPQIDEARRGVQSFEQTQKLADEMGLEVSDILERNKGQPFNAETALAARRIWAQSGERLSEVARVAAENPSEANLVAFRKMMAVHHAIQTEVVAARTETARALGAWRIPAGGTAETARAIDTMLKQSGGADITRDLAKRIAAAGNDPAVLGQIVRRGIFARTRDAVVEAWVMGLLSGPKTHMVNALSNSSVILQQVQERAVAARISQLLGDDSAVAIGEASSQMAAVISSQRDALRLSWRAFRTGETGHSLGKIDIPQIGSISSEGMQMASDTWAGRSVDFIGNWVVRMPGRLLGASDEYFKTIGYRMEINAQAIRQATREVETGAIPKAGLKDRMIDLVNNPPENIRLQAVDSALYQTFTNPTGKFAQMISRTVNEFPVLRFIMPFVRTPANIASYTFKRTPLAPMFTDVRADFKAGGARGTLAASRMASGTAIMLAMMDMAMNGTTTGAGPVDRGQMDNLRRQGWQPYSVKVGDRYFAYNRMDPIGMTMGLGADMSEFMFNTEWGEEDLDSTDELAAAIIGSIGSNLTSKTYLRGISEFFEFMAAPQMFGEAWVKRFGASVVPTGVAEIARVQDPYLRSSDDMMSAIKRRTPGMSEDLPPVRDLWGRPVDFRSGLGTTFDVMSPIYSSALDPEPIDQEFQRLEYFPTKPAYRTSFDGVSVNLRETPEAYSRYIELSGNELKHPVFGGGAMDTLNALVTGNHAFSGTYQLSTDGPEGGKSIMLRDIMNSYRELARAQVLQEFPEIRRFVENERMKRRQAELGG